METTFTNRAMYDKMTSEFIADVKYRLENAYELVKEEDDFRAKLYYNAVDGQFASDCNCCQFCELAKEYEKYGNCLVCDSEKKKYDAWLARLNPDGELEWKENEARCSKYEVHKTIPRDEQVRRVRRIPNRGHSQLDLRRRSWRDQFQRLRLP